MGKKYNNKNIADFVLRSRVFGGRQKCVREAWVRQ